MDVLALPDREIAAPRQHVAGPVPLAVVAIAIVAKPAVLISPFVSRIWVGKQQRVCPFCWIANALLSVATQSRVGRARATRVGTPSFWSASAASDRAGSERPGRAASNAWRAPSEAPKSAALATTRTAKADSFGSVSHGITRTIPARPCRAIGSLNSIRTEGGASAAPMIASSSDSSRPLTASDRCRGPETPPRGAPHEWRPGQGSVAQTRAWRPWPESGGRGRHSVGVGERS